MDKQETAFTVWANSILQPDEEQVVLASDLASKRLGARVRALLWRLYSDNEGVITVMLRLEQRINEGLLRTRNEVGAPWEWKVSIALSLRSWPQPTSLFLFHHT